MTCGWEVALPHSPYLKSKLVEAAWVRTPLWITVEWTEIRDHDNNTLSTVTTGTTGLAWCATGGG
jgi:hypothetical protein